MTDNNTEPEQIEPAPIPPPKLFDQLAKMQERSEAQAAEPVQPAAPEEPVAQAEPPKQKSKVGALLWILIVASVAILAFLFIGLPMMKGGEEPEMIAKPAPVAKPVPMEPRVSVPVPTDAELDAAPVPPAGKDMLAELYRKLTAEITTGEGGLKPLIGKAGLSLIDPVYGLTDDDLKGQNPDAKVLASAYQDMFKRMGEQLGKDGNVLADIDFLAAEQGRLRESVESWQGLQIGKVVLCQRVSGYGRYEAFGGNEFPKNSPPMILVYSELANFKSSAGDDGRFVVKLKEELSLTTATDDAREVWKEREVSVTDTASSRRRDFFIAQYLNLPKTIEPGKYNLQVKITDEADGKIDISVVPLTVKAE